MCDALEWAGAALVHVHAPSPARHGFDPRDTVSRAQAAVAARVHPLVRAQPGGGAPDLAGNPVPGKPWADESAGAARTPAEWALGESRYEAHFAPAGGPAGVPIEEWLFQSPDERGAGKPTVPGPNGGRLAVGDLLASAVADSTAGWMRLRDAAGLSGPAADLARERAERDLRATHDEDLASLRAEYEAKIEEIEKRQLSTQAARLRARLLRLAGLGGPGAERGRDPS
jgi:pyruvate-ferredoxin/flavodoxin oxidoreductase